MKDDLPPREFIALAILIADIFGGGRIAILNSDGQRTKVAVSFEIADEFIKQAKGE